MRTLFSTGAILFASSLLAACGSGSPTYYAPHPAPVTAPVLPTGEAFSATSVMSPPASTSATAITMQLPPSTGYSGHATFPVASVPPNLHMTITYSNNPPSGLSAFGIARKPASEQHSQLDSLSTDVVYACFAANYLVDVDGGPQFVFTLPPGFATSAVVYNLALAQNGTWTDGYGGPGTIVATATSATVSVTGRFGFSIPANGVVCAALFGRSTSAPTPVPATPAPSTSPSPLGVTAAPVAISGGGIALTVGSTDTLSIATADAPATATTTCGTGSIATLTGSPGATLTLTGRAVGTCAVTLTNAAGKATTLTVTVAAQPTLAVTAAPTAISGSGVSLAVGATDTLSIATADAPATATTTCGTGSIATLTGSPGATFTLTGTAVGTCSLTLTNGAGKTATITVTIVGPSASPTPHASSSPGASPSPSASPTPHASSTPSASPSPTPAPTGTAAGNVYVSDQDGYITKYTPSGSQALQFLTSSNDPLGVAVDSTGKIYTANQTGSDLLIYNANGTSAGTITTGAGPQYPAIAPNGNIWMSTSTSADGPHGSVEAFTPGGTRVATVTAGLYGPYGVAVDQSGKVYVANNGGGNVTTYTSSGTQTTPTITLNSAFALAVGPSGKVYVVNGQGLSVYNADGSTSTPSISGSFYSVAVDNAGNIYLLDLITAFPSGNTTCFEYMYSASGVQIGSDFSVSNHCDGIAVH